MPFPGSNAFIPNTHIMKTYQKIGWICLLVVHFGVIVSFNLLGLQKYNEEEVFNQLSPRGQQVYAAVQPYFTKSIPSFLVPYAHLAGTDTGYSLFSPNVPSSMSVAFELSNPRGDTVAVLPTLNTREGTDRFYVNFNTYKSVEEMRTLLAFSWGVRTMEIYPGYTDVAVVLGSHRKPSMKDHRHGVQSHFVESARYEFTLNE